RAHDLEISRHALEQPLEPSQIFYGNRRAPLSAPPDVCRDDPHRAADAGLARPRNVDVAVEPCAEQAVAVAAARIGAHDAVPQVGVPVEVNDLAGQIQIDSLAGDPEVPSPAGGIDSMIRIQQRHEYELTLAP